MLGEPMLWRGPGERDRPTETGRETRNPVAETDSCSPLAGPRLRRGHFSLKVLSLHVTSGLSPSRSVVFFLFSFSFFPPFLCETMYIVLDEVFSY